MSSTKRTVELKPPNEKHTKEMLTSSEHVCGYCKGMGYFQPCWYHRNEEPTPCPVCDGTGMVDAIVTIEWKPSKK
ncbi:MAG: hypothetical protein IJB60_08180 [Bacteroidaceae bacterium]|nr:hypothetical protein [Bacteroidaceae bacterium]